MARPVAIAPERTSGPANHSRISCTNATVSYKSGIVEGRSSDIIYSNLFTGVHGNYLRQSIVAAGLDPDSLPEGELKTMNFGSGGDAKAWRDIWGSGQGIGAIKSVRPASTYVAELASQYADARTGLAGAAAQLSI